MKDAIRKLLTGKAVGLDRILNKAIKAALKALTILLANTTTTYLLKSKLLKCCKVLTIIVLQKVNKKDYSLLKSYRLIALKNSLGKLLKKIIVECIQEAAEA